MCLGSPGEIVSVQGVSAVIDSWGTRKVVRLDNLAEAVVPGDFVIEHDGVIDRLIRPEDVADVVALYEAILGEA